MVQNQGRWTRRLVVFGSLLLYILSIARNATESGRRSLNVTEEVPQPNRMLVLVDVVSVSPERRQLTAQLRFQVVGDIQKDFLTPKVNLRFLVNNIAGQQEFEFPKGKRMDPVDVTFPMDGDVNRYPLDQYTASLRFIITKPRADEASTAHANHAANPEGTADVGELVVGESAFQGRVGVPISVTISASIPGIKFSRIASQHTEPEVTKVELKVERPTNLIVVSCLVMLLMTSLAISVLIMSLKAIGAGDKLDLSPLALPLTLIFGLPALRNIQPGVPPVGALADYVSFIWAEFFVASSAIILLWAWIARAQSQSD